MIAQFSATYGQSGATTSKMAIEYEQSGYEKAMKKDYAGAIKAYSKAIELFNKLNDKDRKLLDRELVVPISMKICLAYFNRGEAKVELNDFQGALEDMTNAIELPGGYKTTNSYSSRAALKVKLNDYPGAIQDYTKAIEIVKTAPIGLFLFRGEAKAKMNDFRGAIIDFNKIIEINQSQGGEAYFQKDAYFQRGNANFSLGKLEDACLDWSKAGELGNAEVYERINEHCK